MRIGLIGSVVPDGTALDAAKEIARTIAGNGPLAVEAILRTLHETDGMTEDEALAYEFEYGSAVFQTQRRQGRPEGLRREAHAQLHPHLTADAVTRRDPRPLPSHQKRERSDTQAAATAMSWGGRGGDGVELGQHPAERTLRATSG